MLSQILKYELGVADKKTIQVDGLIRTLSVAEQKGKVVIYFQVTKQCKHKYDVEIRLVGTGNVFDFDYITYEFMGTVNLMDGALMYHVFVQEKRKTG